MTEPSDSSFQKFCERIAAPAAMVLGLSSALANILESYKIHGLFFFALGGFGVAALWTLYVFIRKKTSRIDPNKKLLAYGRGTRFTALGILVVTGIAAVWVSLPPKPYSLPQPTFEVYNQSDESIALVPEVEFFITLPITPFIESQVASGKLRVSLKSGEGYSDFLAVPRKITMVNAEFLAPVAYRSLFEAETAKILFMWHTRSGLILRAGPIPFQKDWLIGEPITFKYAPVN